MAQPLPGQPSCPNCGARAPARAEACPACGYRFLEDRSRDRPRPRAGLVIALAVALAGLALAAVLVAGDDGDQGAASAQRRAPDVLSSHPLSTRAMERRLEARFTSALDDDTAGARCGALQPRPAHAIRHCRILYPGGAERTVVVLTNPQGRELLVEP